jgi:hypothetical protein
MSANSTNTSDLVARDAAGPQLPDREGGAKSWESAAAMASLPDPAVIARLANEFFALLPGSLGPSALPAAPATGAATGITVPVESVGIPSAAGMPGGPPAVALPTSAAASEADLHTLPATPEHAATRVPDDPSGVPAQGAPGSPATFFHAASSAALHSAPAFPAIADMFTLPGVPDAKSPAGIPISPALPQSERDSRGLSPSPARRA